jgi:hypothetical protein
MRVWVRTVQLALCFTDVRETTAAHRACRGQKAREISTTTLRPLRLVLAADAAADPSERSARGRASVAADREVMIISPALTFSFLSRAPINLLASTQAEAPGTAVATVETWMSIEEKLRAYAVSHNEKSHGDSHACLFYPALRSVVRSRQYQI